MRPIARSKSSASDPGEKLHEVMVPIDDARNTVEYDNYFAILPPYLGMDLEAFREETGGTWCADGFTYSSDNNTEWLSHQEILDMAGLPAFLPRPTARQA